MKILHVIPSYKPSYIYGGTIESSSRLCESLVQFGEDITVYTTTANGYEELDIEPGKTYIVEGVKVIYFKRQTKDPLHLSIQLLKQLYKHCRQFDVVHIHSWWNIPAMAGAFICKKRKVKTVFSPHGMLSTYIMNNSNKGFKKLSHVLIGKSLLKSMILHATSSAELNECRNIITGWKGDAVSNIVWLPDIGIRKTENKVFTILFLSRIHPKKGIEFLLNAISKIDTEIVLLVAGSGDEKYVNKLKVKAVKAGLKNKINWLGWKDREEKFEVLMQADLFVLTSYNENFANAVVEALHVGTPVLVSEGVALSAFVKEQQLGWVCETTSSSVKNELLNAIENKNKRCHIAAIAPAVVKANFSPEVLIPQYRSLYTS